MDRMQALIENVRVGTAQACVVHGHAQKAGSKTDKPAGTPIKCFPFSGPGGKAAAVKKAWAMHTAITKNEDEIKRNRFSYDSFDAAKDFARGHRLPMNVVKVGAKKWLVVRPGDAERLVKAGKGEIVDHIFYGAEDIMDPFPEGHGMDRLEQLLEANMFVGQPGVMVAVPKEYYKDQKQWSTAIERAYKDGKLKRVDTTGMSTRQFNMLQIQTGTEFVKVLPHLYKDINFSKLPVLAGRREGAWGVMSEPVSGGPWHHTKAMEK